MTYAFFFDVANFGPWKFGPQHGFARISRWTVDQAPSKVRSASVVFRKGHDLVYLRVVIIPQWERGVYNYRAYKMLSVSNRRITNLLGKAELNIEFHTNKITIMWNVLQITPKSCSLKHK